MKRSDIKVKLATILAQFKLVLIFKTFLERFYSYDDHLKTT